MWYGERRPGTGSPPGSGRRGCTGCSGPHLDERQRRLLLGAGGAGPGRGGITVVAEATGVHPDTISRCAGGGGQAAAAGAGGLRRPQEAGRYRPAACAALEALVDPATRGDPVSPLRWTCLSTRSTWRARSPGPGHPVSDRTVARLLREQGYSLQGNAEGGPGRPARRPGRPSPATSRRPRPGSSWPPGTRSSRWTPRRKRRWASSPTAGPSGGPGASPEPVNVHDFPSDAIGKAIPYVHLRPGR